MSVVFGSPWWLALLPAWPLLFLLRRRRAARTPRLAADFELWRRAAERLGAPPRRAFALDDRAALLVLALWTTAAADPILRTDAAPPAVTVLVDRSPSLGVISGGRTRLVRALATAAAMRLPGEPRFLGVPAPAADERLSEPARRAPAAGTLEATAAALAAAGETVLVITDRASFRPPPGVGLVRPADDARNAGIVAAALTADGVFVRIGGDALAGPRRIVVEDAAGKALATAVVADAADARLTAAAAPDDVARVRLEPADANAADDVVRFPETASRVRVAADLPATSPWRRALRAQPEFEVVDGRDPAADLFVGTDAAGVAAETPVVLAGTTARGRGFRPGPAQAGRAPLAGQGPFAGAVPGPGAPEAIAEAEESPPGAAPWWTADGRPFVYGAPGVVAVFADVGETYAASPGFPLLVRGVVARLGALRAARARAPEGVLDDEQSRSASTAPAVAEPPPPAASSRRAPEDFALSPLLALAGILVAAGAAYAGVRGLRDRGAAGFPTAGA